MANQQQNETGGLIPIHIHNNLALLEALTDVNGKLYYKQVAVFPINDPDLLNKLTDENGILYYNGQPIISSSSSVSISVKEDAANALILTPENELFVDGTYFLTKEQYDVLSQFNYSDSTLTFNGTKVCFGECNTGNTGDTGDTGNTGDTGDTGNSEVISNISIKNAVNAMWKNIDNNENYIWFRTGVDDTTELYCYRKIINVSNPVERIVYLKDNIDFIPAKMNFTTKAFEYGYWKDAFFMKIKPVMLNFDGTVAYELDPNDYTKKKDGTNSDIANIDFPGNAMVGIPTIWFKRETIDNIECVYVSNKKIDETYKAYAHTDEDGNIMKYTYIPIYNGFIDSSGKLRSISGVTPTCSTTMNQEMVAAELNNPIGKHMWNIETRADVQMLIDLCTLISKSSNSQAAFGNGNTSGTASNIKKTGTMDTNGLFYGTNANNTTGVKIFGIEHFWGNRWKRIAGSMYVNNIMKVKMTYGMQDGSTAYGYNLNSTGYISIENSTISGSIIVNPSPGYIVRTFNNEYGRFVTKIDSVYGGGSASLNGTSDTYDCDAGYFNTDSGTMSELHGGRCNDSYYNYAGCNSVNVSNTTSYSGSTIGASLSCKPNIAENILIPAF